MMSAQFHDGAPHDASTGNKFPVSQLHAVMMAADRQFLLKNCVPWKLFADQNAFSLPHDGGQFVDRVDKNIRSFFANYIVISMACFALFAIIHPSLLVVCALWAGIAYILGQRGDVLRIGEHNIPTYWIQAAIALLGVIYVFTYMGNLIFGMCIGICILVLIHSGLYQPKVGLNGNNAMQFSGHAATLEGEESNQV